jgi:hypothetical protein
LILFGHSRQLLMGDIHGNHTCEEVRGARNLEFTALP